MKFYLGTHQPYWLAREELPQLGQLGVVGIGQPRDPRADHVEAVRHPSPSQVFTANVVRTVMQALLISALTAAFVTLLIEYAAKPHLEVRKDRIVEERRLRREWMAQLRQLDHRILSLITFTHLQTWKLDPPALSELSAKTGALYVEFPLLYPRISKRREVAYDLIMKLDAGVRGLEYMDVIQKQHGILPERLPGGGAGILDYVAREVEKIFHASSGALSVLSISRRRPWSYYSRLKYWSNWAKSPASSFRKESSGDGS